MPQPGLSLRRLIHSRTDLPRPIGMEVARNHSVTVYLPDPSAFDVWRGALERPGEVVETHGWRYVAGYLSVGDQRALATLMVKLTEGTEK